jgi:hypothetical protein
MADEIKPTETTEETQTTETTEEQAAEFSNSDVKNHPLFQKLTGELAALQRADFERKEAAAQAEKQALLEKAKSEERYEDALRIQQETAAAEVEALKQTALAAEMKAALLAQGAKASQGFFKVAMAEYNAETHGDVETYAESLKANEEYSVFFADQSRQALAAPGKLSAPGNSAVLTREQLRALEQSDEPEKRLQAINYKQAYFERHGSFKGLLD